MANSLAELRARRAARDAANAAAAAQPSPEEPPVTEQPAPEEQPATEQPIVLPPGISQEAFRGFPEAIQKRILAQVGGQSTQVNPPEVAKGLAESAAKSAEVAAGNAPEAEAKPKRGRKASAPPAPVDLAPVVEALQGLQASVESGNALLQTIAEQVVKQTEFLEFLAEASA